MKHKKAKRALLCAAVLILALVMGCAVYISDYYRADQTALAALETGDTVTVQPLEDGVAFLPEEPTAGFIFYPGGKVEYIAYAPLLRALAEEGVLCVLTEMPFNLAVLDMNAAEGIPAQYPQVTDWYLGGHSLGGSMAASHAAGHPEAYQGLVLLAAYSTHPLFLPVLSVYGSEDRVLNGEKYAEYRPNLTQLEETVLEGGCHAWFGSYGPQEGDGTPSITPEEQVEQTVELVLEFMQ